MAARSESSFITCSKKLAWLAHAVDLLAAHLPHSQQRRWLAAALAALSHQVRLSTLPEPPSLEQRPAVVAAVVTSARGVLAGRRRDRVPRWAFPSGTIEPNESPAEAAVREVAEETGLRVLPGGEIGRRTHPDPGHTIIYLACTPAGTTGDIVVAGPREFAEVRWLDLRGLDELMPDVYPPAREHVAHRYP